MPETLTLTVAIMTSPIYVKVWLGIMAVTFAASLPFVVQKTPTGWKPRWEAIVIPISFLLGRFATELLYVKYGFVRVLGLGHILTWTPFFVCIFSSAERWNPGHDSPNT